VVDVIAAGARWEETPAPEFTAITQAVTVIALPDSTGPPDSMTDDGALVVLATTPEQAIRLARAGSASRLSITIHGRTQ